MKASALRAKSGDELNKELSELLKAQFGLRMQLATQQLGNTSQMKKERRYIARVRTLLTAKAGKCTSQRRSKPRAAPAPW